MVTEEFSFPKISNPTVPHFTLTPSLWRIPSLVYPDFKEDNTTHDHEEEEEVDDLSSNIEREVNSKMMSSSSSSEEEKKMDLLWEDFNEELKRVSSLGTVNTFRDDLSKPHLQLNSDQVNAKLVVALKMSTNSNDNNNGGFMFHQYHNNKKPRKNLQLLVIKVLKKLFLLQNSAPVNNNHAF